VSTCHFKVPNKRYYSEYTQDRSNEEAFPLIALAVSFNCVGVRYINWQWQVRQKLFSADRPILRVVCACSISMAAMDGPLLHPVVLVELPMSAE